MSSNGHPQNGNRSVAAFLRLLADEIEHQRVVSFEGVAWFGDGAVQGVYRTAAQRVTFRCDATREHPGDVAVNYG